MLNGSLVYAGSYEDTLSWLSVDVLLDPPAAGSSISSENLDKVRPWLPPGHMGELDIPEFERPQKAISAPSSAGKSFVDPALFRNCACSNRFISLEEKISFISFDFF